MAGGDIFGIGTSGLLTAQRQLATSSHNISNVNTEGYSRQRAEQEARRPQFSGSGYIGTGVDVQTTVRMANEFLEEQIRDANSQFGRFDAYLQLSTQIDEILANPDSGLTPTLEAFFSAVQEANDNPSSTPARQVLITEANTMASRFQLLDDRFIELNEQVNQQLVDLTQEVSDAARSIARLNVDIVQQIGAGQGNMPNDLIDQREVLIKQIADNIDVNVVYQDDGAANLFIGTGQTLVIGGIHSSLETQQNQFDALDLDIILRQGNGSVNVTRQVTGGELQGVLDFKFDVLEPSRRSLGRIAVSLSEEMNAQHRLGMTLQGTGAPFPLGGNFFTDLSGDQSRVPTPQVIETLPGQAASSGDYQIEITDSRVLTVSDYRLDFINNTFSLTRLDDNVTYSALDIATLNTLVAPNEGFTIVESAAAAADESFLIRPTFTAISRFDVSVNNVLDVALAGPIVSRQGTDIDLGVGTSGGAVNSGTGDISLPVVNSLTNITPLGQLTLTFSDNLFGPAPAGGGFVVSDGGGPIANITYNPSVDFGGKSFVFDGSLDPALDYGDMSFIISGQPLDGDSFVIEDNSDPYDDNRNGLLMAELQTTKTIENSSTDFQAAYGIIVSNVGTKTHSAQVDLLAQQTLSEQAKANRESYSGVNLDEEAADLLKFQQAYQASAQVISTADRMFQTLISAVG
jgi:flagellar hook-associated protein 1 FlgK